MEKIPSVYILASHRNGAIYIGVTSFLARRITQHKEDQVKGFSSEKQTHTLVWYEYCDTMEEAIMLKKKLKHWRREWKKKLIEKTNPYWNDLSDEIQAIQ